MSKKDDFTSEEWQLLLDVPPMVGLTVMMAGKSGLGSMKEAWAMTSGVLGARNGYEGNELVHALVDARLKDGERSQVEQLNSPHKGKSAEELLAEVESMCKEVKQVLSAKSTADESAGFCDWAITVGEKVANAAKEGGFLGVGGERVSEEEKVALTKVKEALA